MIAILLPQSKKTPSSVDDPPRAFMESFQRITITGWVACGHPIYMRSQKEVDIPSRLIRKNTNALGVRGDSMKDANIFDGDVVVIEQSHLAENGEKVVVRTNYR